MQSLQMIHHLDPALVITSLLALPWLAVSLMHVASAQYRVAFNDAWNLRADAAVRWAKNVIDPTPANSNTVVKFAPRTTANANNALSHLRQAA
jgi:hypothetical protein